MIQYLFHNHSAEIIEQRCMVAYLDGLYPDGDLRQAKVNALRELQSETQSELFELVDSGEFRLLRPFRYEL
jgi:hypothetical protein